MKREKLFCHYIKNIIVLVTIAVITLAISVKMLARDLEIVSFEMVKSDLTARTKPVRDLNDNLCAVIKVAMPDITKFEGANKTVYDFNEYLVYVSPGTKYLNVKTQGTEPLLLFFPNLGFKDGLAEGVTYRLKLTGYSEASAKPINTDLGANYLIMDITPKTGVSVKIDGVTEPLQNGQLMKLLKYGDHTYSVEAPDYETVSGTVTIAKGDKTTLPVVLKSMLGTLVMNIRPESNASVIIDGKKEAVTNGKVSKSLRYGEYTYQVDAPGYDSQSGTVTINKGTTATVSVNLESVMANLTVNSETPGANILINGQSKGTRRWSGELTPGVYEIEVTKDSYRPQKQVVDLVKRDSKVVTIPALTPIYGVLNIAYQPIGAEIYIDGNKVGTTPLVLNDILIGSHNIELKNEGYQSLNRNVTISENKPLELGGELEKGGINEFKVNWASKITPKQKEIITELLKNMVYVEGGSFMMGSNDPEARDHEKPVHKETVESFYIGKYEVTQKEWKIIMGNNPSHHKGDNLPVYLISWKNCQNFINKLNILTGLKFRLPSEAEWEYAARGGNKSKGYKYSGSNNLDEVGWYDKNSDDRTHPVGQKAPNELGLYDMSGNVLEWTADNWSQNYNSPRVSHDVSVVRGGSWSHDGWFVFTRRWTSKSQQWTNTNIGFRLAL